MTTNRSEGTRQEPAGSTTKKKPEVEVVRVPLSVTLRRWDVLLAGLGVLALVLAASVSIRTSSVWLHLAAGRGLLAGEYSFGQEPFTYTGSEYWTNSAWLFDIVSYLAHQAFGDWALVVLRIAVLWLLGVTLLAVQQRGMHGWGIAAASGLVALTWLWLFQDLRPHLENWVTDWWILGRLALVLVLGLFATSPDNWMYKADRWIGIATTLLAAAIAAWLAFDTGLAGTWPLLKTLLLVLFIRGWRLLLPAENTLWPAAFGTLLATVAVAPWFEWGPMLVSFTLVGAVVWFLIRGLRTVSQTEGDGLALGTLRSFWPVFLCFIVWSNVDAWFVLGLAIVALFALGEIIAWLTGGATTYRAAAVGLTLVIAAAVCVINPHHVRAFASPDAVNLLFSSELVRADPAFDYLRVKPWDERFLWQDNLPRPAALGWWVLFGLSGISFIVGFTRECWPRLLIWAGLAAATVVASVFLPFFAIAAAVIQTVNFREQIDRQLRSAEELKGGTRALVIAARPLSVLVALVAIALAWSGALVGRFGGVPYWEIDRDPYVIRAAEKIRDLRERGVLRQGYVGLNLAAEPADYFAYFCPQERTFFDSRLRADPEKDRDLLTIRRALFGVLPDPLPTVLLRLTGIGAAPFSAGGLALTTNVFPGCGDPFETALVQVRPILRRRRVEYLVLHSRRDLQLTVAFFRLYDRPEEWPLLHFDGRTAIFGWRDPSASNGGDRFAQAQIRLYERAMRSPAVVRDTKRWPRSWGIADAFIQPLPPPSAKREEAALHLVRFTSQKPSYMARIDRIWKNSQAAGLIGDIPLSFQGACAGVIATGLRSRLDLDLQQQYFLTQDRGPVPSLFAAIRAARRAIQDNPRDATAYLYLGRAYAMLSRDTREAKWCESFTDLGRLRTVQAIAALKQALRLNPDLLEAHYLLVNIYKRIYYRGSGERGPAKVVRKYLDLELEHLKEILRLQEKQGQSSYELREMVAELERTVRSNRELLESRVKDILLIYVERCLELGLGGAALQALLESDVSSFGREGMLTELEQLLDVGRVAEVDEWMAPDYVRDNLGSGNYHWLQVQLAAAIGDYTRADRNLQMTVAMPGQFLGVRQAHTHLAESTARVVGKLLLDRAQPHFLKLAAQVLPVPVTEEGRSTKKVKHEAVPQLHLPPRFVIQQIEASFVDLRQTANVSTMRGVLALERGAVRAAADHFADALSAYDGRFDFTGRPVAQGYANLIAEAQRK